MVSSSLLSFIRVCYAFLHVYQDQAQRAVVRRICLVPIAEVVLSFAFHNAVAELGRDALTADGYHVLGGYMSPVNDQYNKKVPLSRLASSQF